MLMSPNIIIVTYPFHASYSKSIFVVNIFKFSREQPLAIYKGVDQVLVRQIIIKKFTLENICDINTG